MLLEVTEDTQGEDNTKYGTVAHTQPVSFLLLYKRDQYTLLCRIFAIVTSAAVQPCADEQHLRSVSWYGTPLRRWPARPSLPS